ncbi:MAG: YheV family putative zinc ribbon protein [Pseudomonadota bacterium]
MKSRSKRQFIAGAACPACGAQDSLVQTVSNESKSITCVECGYEDLLNQNAEPPSKPAISIIPTKNLDS